MPRGRGRWKDEQTRRQVTETESREIIRSEIIRQSAMSQFVLYPKTLRMSEIIIFGLWRAQLIRSPRIGIIQKENRNQEINYYF